MKRSWVVVLSAFGTLVAGCGLPGYESRMNKTLERLEREQKINSFLQPAAQGKFKELSLWLRPPKPMAESKLLLSDQPGLYDLTASFLGAPAQPPPGPGQDPLPDLPPMRLHVLARMKKTPKKGEPPQPAVAARGAFIGDVRAFLANEIGPGAADKSPQNDKKGNTSFKRLIFPATSGDTIQVYFTDANKGQTEVALIFDIPPDLRKNPIATTGIELCLESFAIGGPALRLFNNGGKSESDDEEGGSPSGPGF